VGGGAGHRRREEAVVTTTQVRGFALALDGRRYAPASHMWVIEAGPGRLRIGLDPLGVETNGTLAQLSFVARGTRVEAGRPFGHLEAAKFVGPLLSPLSGTVLAANEAVLADPSIVERDPLHDGWLVEISPDGGEHELAVLLATSEEIVYWYAAKIDEYRLKGVIAE
jgi:glycine cleavage system H protein